MLTISYCKSHLKDSLVSSVTRGGSGRDTEKERDKNKEGQKERERGKGEVGRRKKPFQRVIHSRNLTEVV